MTDRAALAAARLARIAEYTESLLDLGRDALGLAPDAESILQAAARGEAVDPRRFAAAERDADRLATELGWTLLAALGEAIAEDKRTKYAAAAETAEPAQDRGHAAPAPPPGPPGARRRG